jgi:hypothetical protein
MLFSVLPVLKYSRSGLGVGNCFLDLTQDRTQNSGEVSGRILGCVVVLMGVLECQMLMVEVLM